MLDIDRYLERIGLRGRPGLAEVHRAHVCSIPFENLDPLCGRPVVLEPEHLERKLVAGRRGGYCFEQNLLLKSALEALGAEVELLLARVRMGAPPGAVRPRAHLVLRVHAEDAVWHADAGFGLGTPLEPLPFGPGNTHEQSGWQFRVVEDGPDLVLQTHDGEAWTDVYGFSPQPVPMVDLEVSNFWTSTYPRSPFVTGLMVAIHRKDGTRLMLSDRDGLSFSEQTPNERTVRALQWEQVPALLGEHFGLHGFALGADDRLTPAAPAPVAG